MLDRIASRRHRSTLLALLGIVLLLASCAGPSSGPGGPSAGTDPFAPEHRFGGPAPAGAEIVDATTFQELAEASDFRLEGPSLRAERDARAEVLHDADLEVFEAWTARDPDVARLLTPPDGGGMPVVDSGRGSFLYTFEDRSGTSRTVSLLGAADELRDLVAANEAFEDAANQLAVYRAGYAAVPPASRGGLASPATLAGASYDELLAANAQLEATLADAVLEIEAAALARVRLAAQLADPPPGFPASGGLEERSGTGGDRTGMSCARAQGGAYLNLDWPQKYFTTSTKMQGRRGTCVAFALASAAETEVAIREGRWTNLSEQFLYNRTKSVWDPDDYDDGASTVDTAERLAAGGYRLPFEDQWNYNPSYQRLAASADSFLDFQWSCVGYGERCSDTAHQGQFVCTLVSGETYCGTRPPNPDGEGERMDAAVAVLWTNMPWSAGMPVSLLRALLAGGQPVVASLRVAEGFDDEKLDANGFLVHYGDDVGGGHAVHVTGYVGNDDLASALPDAPPGQGGGYLVVKNSWGTCYGDGGLVYVPVAWAEEFFKHLVVFVGVDPSDVFTNTPPEIDILAPEDGATLPQGAAENVPLSASVSDAEDGADCCSVSWTSSLDGPLGNGPEITVGFATPGFHLITAVATDSDGATARDDVVVEVVNAPPEPEILAPTPGEEIPVGIPTTVRGRADDPGNLGVPCDWLSWTSSAASDPFPLGGCDPQVTFETMGVRTLTLTVEDDGGASAATSVEFVVVPAPELWTSILAPKPESLFLEGSPVELSGVLSQAFELPATYTWYAHVSGRGGRVAIATGDVMLFTVTGSKLIPDTSWIPGDDGIGTGAVALELEVDGANGTAGSTLVPIQISKLE